MNSIYRQLKQSGMAAIALTMLAAVVLLAGAALPAQAQTETLLHQFTGSPDGFHPETGVVLKGTTLYGTTNGGGDANGDGIVYKLTTAKGKIKETILHTFAGWQNGDGANPMGGVVFDTAGNLYGTTYAGGPGGTYGNVGTIYKIAKDGTETVLYSFSSSDGNGFNPYFGTLAIDKLGNLYGTTVSGGTIWDASNGTVFKLAPDGTLTTLHTFSQVSGDGYNPVSGVTLDTKGNLYGTTPYGGAYGNGVLYEITASGVYSILYNFTGGADGGYPLSPLVYKGGSLYGTAQVGGSGCGAGCGVIFKYTLAKGKKPGTETVLHYFAGGANDGWNPQYGLLVFDKQGNIYGTTANGGSIPDGANNMGTVYKLATDGTLTLLYSFDNQPDGMSPWGNVALDAAGNVYTTATYGGNGNGEYGDGTVIKITP